MRVAKGVKVPAGCLIADGVVIGEDAKLRRFERVSRRKETLRAETNGVNGTKEDDGSDADDEDDDDIEEWEEIEASTFRFLRGREAAELTDLARRPGWHRGYHRQGVQRRRVAPTVSRR